MIVHAVRGYLPKNVLCLIVGPVFVQVIDSSGSTLILGPTASPRKLTQTLSHQAAC